MALCMQHNPCKYATLMKIKAFMAAVHVCMLYRRTFAVLAVFMVIWSIYASLMYHYLIKHIGPPLRFIPTGNIALGQRALFHCLVDSSSMSISWKIDGKFLTDGDVADKIEYYNGAGTPNSTLALKGIRDNNNTIVICTASGSFGGGPYSTSFSAVVKIQGQYVLWCCAVLPIRIRYKAVVVYWCVRSKKRAMD